MIRRLIPFQIAALILALSPAATARAEITVVTTTETLAVLAREIGGDRIEAESIARGYQDPHFVEPKPSFILKLYRADLLILVGRDLEIGWLPALITQSRNRQIRPGAEGYLDASFTATILEIPQGQITRAMGDVHPLGNPHYLLGPANGRRVAKAIQQKLTQQSPDDAAYFAERYADFDRRLATAEARWDASMVSYAGTRIVTYHRSWANFVDRFKLDVVGYVEPRPGIPPSPAHVVTLIQEMRSQGIKLILVEPYFDLKTPEAIARQADAQVLVLASAVGATEEIGGYIELFDHNLVLLASALDKLGAQ